MAQTIKIVDTSRGFAICDPNAFPANLHHSYAEDQPEKTIPILAYEGYNFMPTVFGYKSFFGTNTKLNILPLVANVDHIILFQFVTYQNCLVALCDTGIYTAITETAEVDWVQEVTLTPPVGGEHLLWTYTVIENKLYMYRQGDNFVYVLAATGIDELNDITITTISPSFLNMAGQMGIFRANGRLGFWDTANSISWSSVLDLADFTPSVTTLAGNGIFTGVRGRIVAILPQGDGFIVYSTKNIVGVRYAAKDNFLWEANAVIETAGITLPTEVTFGTSDLEHYAFTSSGIKKIGLFDIVSRQQKVEEVFTPLYDLLKEEREPLYLQFLNGRYLFISTVSNTYINGKISFVWDSTGDVVVRVLTGGDYWDPDIVVPPFTYLSKPVKPIIEIDPLNVVPPVGGGEDVVIWYIYVDVDGVLTLVDQITVGTNQMSQLIRYSLTAGPWEVSGSRLSRWDITGQSLQYFHPFPSTPWYDVGATDIELSFLPTAVGSGVYSIRTTGINDPNVLKLMYAQVALWEQFKIDRLVDLTKIASYTRLNTLNDFAVVTVSPGDPIPVMGEGTYATVLEEVDLGLAVTGLGVTVFEKGYVPAQENQQQWFRMARHFQQVRRVKYIKSTSYSIERIEHIDVPACRSIGERHMWVASTQLYTPPNCDSPAYNEYIYHATGSTCIEAATNFAGQIIGNHNCPGNVILTTRSGGDVGIIDKDGVYLTTVYCYSYAATYYDIYHITRTIDEWYEVTADPGSPDGSIYATSEITGYESYRDDIIYNQGQPEVTGTLEFTPPTELPPEGYPVPLFDPANPTFKFYGFPVTIHYGGFESQNPFDVANGTLGEEVIGTPVEDAEELVTIPGYIIKGAYHLPVTVDVILPGSKFLLQTGVLGPTYPTFSGAFVYDTSLEKWGKCKTSYKQLFDFSPINSTIGQSIPYRNFGLDVGIIDAAGDCYLFDQFPADSFIRYGKFGLSRNSLTQLQQVKLQAVTPSTGTITIDTSLDGRSLELTLRQETAIDDVIDIEVPTRKTGKWHTVSLSGIFDISYLAFTANKTGTR